MSKRSESILTAVLFVAFWVGSPVALWHLAKRDEIRADEKCTQVCEFVGSTGRRFNKKCVCSDGTTPLRGFGQ